MSNNQKSWTSTGNILCKGRESLQGKTTQRDKIPKRRKSSEESSMFCTAFHHLEVLSAPVLAERLGSCVETPSVSKGQESKNGYLRPAKEEGLENTTCYQMGPPKEYMV